MTMSLYVLLMLKLFVMTMSGLSSILVEVFVRTLSGLTLMTCICINILNLFPFAFNTSYSKEERELSRKKAPPSSFSFYGKSTLFNF